jgi:hypothetical protein
MKQIIVEKFGLVATCDSCHTIDVRGSVHHSAISKEKSNKMQQYIQILLFHIYMKHNMFRATHAHHQEPKTAMVFHT